MVKISPCEAAVTDLWEILNSMRYRNTVLFVMLGLASAAHASFGFQTLSPLPCQSPAAEAFGLSPDGTVPVGFSYDSSNRSGAVYWASPGSPQELGFVNGAQQAVATAASTSGSVIVGTLGGGQGYDQEAVEYTAGAGGKGLGWLPGAQGYSVGTGVSADGSTVVGYSDVTGGREAFKWTESQGMIGIGYLDPSVKSSLATGVSADGSVITGDSWSATTSEGFYYRNGAMVGIGVLPGAASSSAFALSEDGRVVVGSSYINGNTTEAFAWTAAGGMKQLGYLPGVDPAKYRLFSEADAVSSNGATIVGQAIDASGANLAVVWQQGSGMTTLASLLTKNGVDLGGDTLWDAVGVSADGSVIDGWGRDSNGHLISWMAEITPEAVPEPAPFAALAAGLTVIARRRRYRPRFSRSVRP